MGRIIISHRDTDFLRSAQKELVESGHWVISETDVHLIQNRILSHRPDVLILEYGSIPDSPLHFITHLTARSLGPVFPVVILASPEDAAILTVHFQEVGEKKHILVCPHEIIAMKNVVNGLFENPIGDEENSRRFLSYGTLELDQNFRAVRLGASKVSNLPPKMFNLLWILVRNAIENNDLCTRSFLIARVWKSKVRDREVDVAISRLKNRLPFLAAYIQSVPGKGYRFFMPSLSTFSTEKNKKSP
jgi:DNA-binding response OmpR family regulator